MTDEINQSSDFITFEDIKLHFKIVEDIIDELRFIVVLGGHGVGDFVLQNMVASFYLRQFSKAYSLAVFADSHPYRNFIVNCNPLLHGAMNMDAASGITMPVDWFDAGLKAIVRCPDQTWYDKHFHVPALVLVPSMLSLDAARLSGLAESPPHLFLPPKIREPLFEALKRLGLQEDQWFVTLGPGMDDGQTDPHSYESLIRHIIEEQGGRVVLVGEAGEDQLQKTDGVIDLRRVPDSFTLQVIAVSQSRYFIGSDPNFLCLASAFRVLQAAVNVVSFSKSVWNRGDVVLAKRITLADGRELGTEAAFLEGHLDDRVPNGLSYTMHPTKTLAAVADHLFEKSEDCTGWRQSAEPSIIKRTETVTLPLSFRDDVLVHFWD